MPSAAPAKAKTKASRPTTPKSTSSKDESFVSRENTTGQACPKRRTPAADRGGPGRHIHLRSTDADDDDVPATANNTWHDIYTSKSTNQNVPEYFMSRFYRYLLHVEGGADHTRQVHNILSTLDPAGSDLACLAYRMGMDVWDNFRTA